LFITWKCAQNEEGRREPERVAFAITVYQKAVLSNFEQKHRERFLRMPDSCPFKELRPSRKAMASNTPDELRKVKPRPLPQTLFNGQIQGDTIRSSYFSAPYSFANYRSS
jgi:hypothetical protein